MEAASTKTTLDKVKRTERRNRTEQRVSVGWDCLFFTVNKKFFSSSSFGVITHIMRRFYVPLTPYDSNKELSFFC